MVLEMFNSSDLDVWLWDLHTANHYIKMQFRVWNIWRTWVKRVVSSGLVVFMGEPPMSVKVKRTIAVPPSSRKHFPTLTAVHALRIGCWRWTRASLWPTFVRFASPGQKWRNEGCSPSACAWTQDSVLPPSSSACRRRRAGGTVNREERVIDHYNN